MEETGRPGLDEDDRPLLDEDDRSPAFSGTRARPELVASLTPALRMAQLGNVLAAVAVATSVGALATLSGLSVSRSSSSGSPTTGTLLTLGCSILMLVICTIQHVAWQRALSEWRGERDHDLIRLSRLSWAAHLASYAVLLGALWSAISGSLAAGRTSVPADLLALTLLFLLGAQASGAVQFLRSGGPSGTVPGHLRRLATRQR